MTETATFTYIDWQDKYRTEKPYQLFSATNSNVPTTNLVFRDGPPETIHDVRGRQDEFSLETHGFAFVQHDIPSGGFENAEWVESEYFTQLEKLLREKVEGVDRICFFDWRIRKNVEVANGIINADDRMAHFLPARHVHIDQTPSAVLGRIMLHVPEHAEKCLQGRVRVINLWRPLVDVVQDRPLAVCDIRTVQSGDLVDADHVRKHYSGSNYYLKRSENYKWYYLSSQERNEVTMLQMFDSSIGGVSGCPHSSFELGSIPTDALKRESIEVRALVFSSA